MPCCFDNKDRNKIWRESEEKFVEYKKRQPEAVHHPGHYHKDSGIEVIDAIDAWNLDFCLGNAVKYISRSGYKDADKTQQDLQKAVWYILRYLGKEDKYKFLF
tara:strand:+ start:64 stop:372 length:309 start_codon:yes stop_codon:yes gene_type:complete